ncbi:MAG: 2-oxoacid:acceptor oxidoreductase family protein [Desulfobacterales bacterium]|nr:MAG: 2-oxoacid:acceptor oxidoreductase family protein [Desulfobacterales bacterium]
MILNEILIAGFGGQGIMLMGKLLAYGAIYKGLEVTFYPSYGPEMRGGTANCTVVISDQRIGSPVRNEFAYLMAMNQASVDKFSERIKPGGVIVCNATLVESPPERRDVKIVKIPANQIAMEMENPQVANMVAMGGLIHELKIISYESLTKGLVRVLPQYRHNLIPLNEQAIQKGFEALEKKLNLEGYDEQSKGTNCDQPGTV